MWWDFFAYYWDTPFYSIVEVLEKISSTPVLLITGIYLIFLFFSLGNKNTTDGNTENNKNYFFNRIKKVVFIICLVIWIILIARILLSSIQGFHCSICGFDGSNGGTTYYGIEALGFSLISTLFLFTTNPIYPISLIYIITYIIKKNSRKKF